MVIVAQLVRAPDCGSGGRGFETPHSPHFKHIFKRKCVFFAQKKHLKKMLFVFYI